METNNWDELWLNAMIATCNDEKKLLQQGALATYRGKIAWVGTMAELEQQAYTADHIHDVKNKTITPGFIDCHTHVVYAGDRSNEFAMRLQGKTYEEIARAGGGIHATVRATQNASEDELFAQSIERVKVMMANGVTTLEIKSGYGLDQETELKMLRVAKRIEETLPITIYKTFLGAHVIPSLYRDRADDYVAWICHDMIPMVAEKKLAEAVDVFCETIAFNLAQTELIFQAAKKNGLDIKCHAEQLSAMHASELAAKYQALSVDHLEHLSDTGIAAMSEANTVAVLLPGAYYFLREKKMPPIAALKARNVPIALASDCNPGTSPVLSLLLIMNLACVLFGFKAEDALCSVTLEAAKALGKATKIGSISVGKDADFAVWNVRHPDELPYYLGARPLAQLIRHGKIVL